MLVVVVLLIEVLVVVIDGDGLHSFVIGNEYSQLRFLQQSLNQQDSSLLAQVIATLCLSPGSDWSRISELLSYASHCALKTPGSETYFGRNCTPSGTKRECMFG